MQIQDRKKYVLQQLNEKSSVTVTDLSDCMGISEVTVRKLLATMEQEGQLKRTWGGAICTHGSLREFSHNEKEMLHLEEKQAIARAAYERINDGDAIFLDVGTTTLQLAKLIVTGPKRNILVCTNSIHLGMELSQASDIQVIVIGGELRGNIYSCVGSIAEQAIQQLFFDKGFLSGNHFTLEHGFTAPIIQEADLKRRVLSVSKASYFLLDSSKFGDDSLVLVVPPTGIDALITDWNAPPELVRGFADKGVQVILGQPK